MSGRKQHFIPQSLLKGFGRQKGKHTYVVAYTYDRGIFAPSTEGIGAERHFYSELDVDGESETLDDRITDYEQPFPEILKTLRGIPNGEVADPKVSAEFVTHLAIRNDHFRKSVATGGTNLLEGISDAFTDESNAKAILGVSGGQASGMFASQMVDLWAEYGALFAAMGMSEAQFKAQTFEWVKGNFSSLHNEMTGPLSEVLKGMVEQLPNVAADSQRRGLDGGLSPPLRVQKLSELQWIIYHPEKALVLPDCVSVAFDGAGQVHPLMLADLEQIEAVIMPLSSHRLLVGSRDEAPILPGGLNRAFAECSWDFFVAQDRNEQLVELRNLLRTRVTEFLGDTVRDVLEEAITKGGIETE